MSKVFATESMATVAFTAIQNLYGRILKIIFPIECVRFGVFLFVRELVVNDSRSNAVNGFSVLALFV